MAVTSTNTFPSRGYYITNPNNAPVLGKFLKITIHFPETSNLMSPAKYVFFWIPWKKLSFHWDNPNGMRPNLHLESWMGHLQRDLSFSKQMTGTSVFENPGTPLKHHVLLEDRPPRLIFALLFALSIFCRWILPGKACFWIDLIHAGMYSLRNLVNGSEWIILPLAQGRICSNPSGFLRGQVFWASDTL